MADEKSVSATPSKSGGGRSVNYPGIPLDTAIRQVKKLWDSFGKNAVFVADAGKEWGYGEKSSGLRTTVSAMKQFGLLTDMGDGDRRQVKLSDRGLDIAIEPDGSAKRLAAIKAAALAPKIYSEVFSRFPDGLPAADHAIASYLLREKDFNRSTVDAFIAGFRANIALANLVNPANMPDVKDEEAPPPDIEVGDLVQWENSGTVMFAEPKRVRAIQEHDGSRWVFVDGEKVGLPMAEVTVEKRAEKGGGGITPPPPTLELPAPLAGEKVSVQPGEREWLRGPLSKDVSYRLIVSGDMGEKEIGKLVRLLKAQQDVLADDDDDAQTNSTAGNA